MDSFYIELLNFYLVIFYAIHLFFNLEGGKKDKINFSGMNQPY